MKIKIAILGSTGSIGKTTVNIIRKDKKNFKVCLLTANNNYYEIEKQIKELNPKNIIIKNFKHFLKLKKKFKNKKINFYNNFDNIKKIFKSKIDYTMCSISGLDGLKPTLNAIEFSKKVAIANKESLVCAWNLIEKKLKKNKTKFIPVDSEHFSIWSLIKNSKNSEIDKVIITASGGPFLNLPLKNFKKITPNDAIKHPNWSMGKKISVDSATMMNKVFEVIEAQRIFNIDLKKFKILIHPKSYIHAIIKFKNGLTKILIHETDMKIPIFNSIYIDKNKAIKSKDLNLKTLNDLNLMEVDKKKFSSLNIIKKIPPKNTLYETILVSANDELVNLFLKNKISFNDISKKLNNIISLKEFIKFKKKSPRFVDDIVNLNKLVRLKTRSLSVLSSNV